MSHNLQYRRAHKDIINAFIHLACRNNFEDITVQDILDEALVSRHTFYSHFKDKYEIAEILQDQLIESFHQMMRKIKDGYEEGILEQSAQTQLWFAFAKEHREIFQALHHIHTDTIDLERFFRHAYRELYLTDKDYYTDSPTRNLEADLCADMQITLMNYYTEEMHLTPGDFGETTKAALINTCIYMAKLKSPQKARDALKPFL